MNTSSVIKKPLNLHKFNVKFNDFIPNRQLVLPVLFSLAGMILGCMNGKGEGKVYLKITELFGSFLSYDSGHMLSSFLNHLLLPSIFVVVLFFLGLSAYGGFAVNLIPGVYSFLIGTVSYYMYSRYTLKGLAYCIMLLFPYAVVSLTGLVLSCAESIKMSELILRNISKSKKYIDYSFGTYYKAYLKSYLYVFMSAVVKVFLDYLFVGLFVF